MSERRPGDRVPDLLVEQLALGELGDHAAASVRARLEAEPEGLARLARLEADDHAIREAYPAARVMASVRARAERAPRRAARWLAPAFGVAVAAVAVLVVARPWEPGGAVGGGAVTGPDVVRTKGDVAARLFVYREGEGGGGTRLVDGAQAAGGDTLQLAYAAGTDARFGVIVSIDGAGAVTLHWPLAENGDTRLADGGEVRLRDGYELDDAPGFERFVLVTGDAPIAVGDVLAAARRLAGRADARSAPLPVPPGLAQTSVVVTKEAAP
ncbi:MAG: ActD-like protein [Myxococcales bacterium]|nr:ActD-like protein [Myxococcales bacterium]